MPTTWPPPRHEATAAAPPAPVPSRRVALRRAVGRYVRARWARSVGRVPRPAGGLEPTDARAGGGDRDRAARGFDLPIAHWGRGGGPPPRPQEYEADAVPARAFFAGAIVSVLIAGYHLVHGHRSSVLASLGMAFVLAGVALGPAYRCWRLRTRDPGPARAFLRHPAAWWPDPRPPDQEP